MWSLIDLASTVVIVFAAVVVESVVVLLVVVETSCGGSRTNRDPLEHFDRYIQNINHVW